MKTFFYKYINQRGQIKKGKIYATGLEQAQDLLASKNLSLVDLKERASFFFAKQVKQKDLLHFFLQLSDLLDAQIPLYEGLNIIQEGQSNLFLSTVIADLKKSVHQGKSLSQGMKKHPQIFDHFMQAMVYSGEESGRLKSCMQSLSEKLKKTIELTTRLREACIYPIILSLLCTLLIFGIFFFVIPNLKPLLINQKSPLTLFMLASSDFLIQHSSFVFLFLLCTLFSQWKYALIKKIQRFCLLNLPYLNHAYLKYHLSLFSKNLSCLLMGGVPLLKSLEIIQKSIEHKPLKEKIENVTINLSSGSNFSLEFKKDSFFPNSFATMLCIAQEAGSLAVMLEKISRIYEKETSYTLQTFLQILTPCLIILMGAFIALLICGLILPMMDTSNLFML